MKLLPKNPPSRLERIGLLDAAQWPESDCSGIEPGLLLRLQAAAFLSSPTALLISDLEGDIVWANPASESLTGYPCSQLLGQNMRIFKSGAHNPEVYRSLWTALLSGRPWRGRLINRHADGSLRTEELVAFPLSLEDDKPSHFVASRRDMCPALEAEFRERHRRRCRG